MQQRAERRKGQDAIGLYEVASSKFAEALQSTSLPQGKAADAAFGLGECQQFLADALLEACASLTDEQLTPTSEGEVSERARGAYEKAVQAYELVS